MHVGGLRGEPRRVNGERLIVSQSDPIPKKEKNTKNGRTKPERFFSHFFPGSGLHHGVGRLALYVFMQCAFREPQRVPHPPWG